MRARLAWEAEHGVPCRRIEVSPAALDVVRREAVGFVPLSTAALKPLVRTRHLDHVWYVDPTLTGESWRFSGGRHG
jgi:hypothetical protein